MHPLRLFYILQAMDPAIQPNKVKIHLATSNGSENPLALFRSGDFDEYQACQSRRNFERPQVLALIAMQEKDHWLFAGTYDCLGRLDLADGRFKYRLVERPNTTELNGRVIISFVRSGRSAYINAERWLDYLEVLEIRAERHSLGKFPGFAQVHLSKADLDFIVREQLPSWRSALGSVAGVYVISDEDTGRLYVGSATGESGFWGRWSEYARTGHGGNRDLQGLLEERGARHARHFRYSILETADSKTGVEAILQREAHWKVVLLTREYGYNAN